jgi:hypothetical protein
MISSRSIFYEVPVTNALSEALMTGQYPHEVTQVTKCVLALTTRRISEGMELLAFRKLPLQYVETFNDLAKATWQKNSM